MSPKVRLISYVISYEIIAIALIVISLTVLGFDGSGSGIIAVVSSLIALTWNTAWNIMFEAWEQRQVSQKRTVLRRIAHAVGFESGLIVVMVPAMAWILKVSLFEAFILDIGLLALFLIYTFVFAWLFDIILPPAYTTSNQNDVAVKKT